LSAAANHRSPASFRGRAVGAPDIRLATSTPTRFESLVLPHLDAAYTLARYLMRDPHDAEDATQEAMLKALRHVDQCRADNARPWLFAIVRNTCHTWLRRRGNSAAEVSFDETLHSDEAEALQPDTLVIRAADQDSVQRALAALPLPFREVVVLRELQGLSYKEIAEVAEVPIGTVMSRLGRARERLESLLGGSAEKEGQR
jgi:RNA polymerase sigma factor (sigma-70 family)